MDNRAALGIVILAGIGAYLFSSNLFAAQANTSFFPDFGPSPDIPPDQSAPTYTPPESYTPVESTPQWLEPSAQTDYYANFLSMDNMDTPGANVSAFLALIRTVESNNDYTAIQGGDHFYDFSWHPFDFAAGAPPRDKLGTSTASGAYQMVLGTWKIARDALGLTDFTPESQDAAAIWILQYKRPRSWPYVQRGMVKSAMLTLQNEWESFQKILAGTYNVNVAQAENIYQGAGGILA